MFIIDKMKELKIDGFTLKDFGGMGINSVDAGAIVF